jgi:hypothetical protein
LNNAATIALQGIDTVPVEIHRSECNIIGGTATNITIHNTSSVLIQNVAATNLLVAFGCTAYLSGTTTIANEVNNTGTIVESDVYEGSIIDEVDGGIVIDNRDNKVDDSYMRSDFMNHTDIGDNGAVQVIASDGTGSAVYTVINIHRKEKGGVKVVYGHVQGTLSGLAGGAIPVIRLRADYAHNFSNGAIVDLKGQTESDTIVLGRCYNNTDIRWGEITGGYITGYNGAFNIDFMFTTLA